MISIFIKDREFLLDKGQFEVLNEHWRAWAEDYIQFANNPNYIRKYSNCDEFVYEFLENLFTCENV